MLRLNATFCQSLVNSVPRQTESTVAVGQNQADACDQEAPSPRRAVKHFVDQAQSVYDRIVLRRQHAQCEACRVEARDR